MTGSDATATDKIEVEYPIGHRRRRAEGVPVLQNKFRRNLATRFPADRVHEIFALCQDAERLSDVPVHAFMDRLVI